MNNKFIKKNWLKNIDRIEDINPERMDTNPKEIRLHRAERLTDFPKTFFNNFINDIKQEDIRLYPDTTLLKKKIAEHFEINKENILLFSGSAVGIKTFMESFCIPDKYVIISKICYPMHFLFPQIQNSKLKYITHNTIKINDNILKMELNLLELFENINHNICCICIANPNSPLGDILTLDNLELILKKASVFDIPVLIDEAYIEFSNSETSIKLLDKYDNLVISKTFSKSFGAAGLRCGYLISNNTIIKSIKKIMYPYEITHITAKFCSKLIDNYNIVKEYIDLIKLERDTIFSICNKNKIKYIESQLNTIHIKPNNIDIIYKYLQENNVRCKFRFINENKYLAISLFISLHKTDLFKTLLNYHNN
jgi:histidinol-phosphate aminotransferase